LYKAATEAMEEENELFNQPFGLGYGACTVIPALRKQRQEYYLSFRPFWSMQGDPVSKNHKNQTKLLEKLRLEQYLTLYNRTNA
jgi:hypothetical protein